MVSRIMVVQRRYTGHHLAYVAMFADWSQRVGIEMTLLVKPGTDGTPEWQEHLSPYASHLELIEGETDLEHALSVARDRVIDRIVFPGGDHYLLPILRHWRLCREVPLTVLIMRPNGQQSASAFVRPLKSCSKWILRSLAARMSRATIFTLTSALNPRPRRRELRDPVWSQRAPSEAGLKTSPADRRWIGVVGSLSARKNVELIAETIVARPGLHNTGLLLAGRQSDTVRRQLGVLEKPLEEAGVDLRIVDRTLSDEELVRRGGQRRCPRDRPLQRGGERHPRDGGNTGRSRRLRWRAIVA